MTIRNRLTLLFSLLFAVILLLFCFVVYFSYDDERQDEYYTRLKQQAVTRMNLLYDVKIEPKILQTIYRHSPNALIHEEVAIYDTAFNLLYHDAVDIDFVKETKSMIAEIQKKKEIRFWQEEHQVIGFSLNKNGNTYIITGAGVDKSGLAKLQNLRFILIVAFVVSMLLIFIAGRFFSKRALKPVSDMVIQVKDITATNLDLRVNEGNRKDEIAGLAITFNDMLDRLEKSFDSQKQFVSNISHELRTPLAAIIGELELSTNKERNIQEYKSVIENALSDARKLARLSNSLLDFAKASYDPSEIKFKKIRLDEILLDAQQQVKKSATDYKISLHFENEIQGDTIEINGNEYLLKIAFVNLMENACKFSSDRHCDVYISLSNEAAIIRVSDKGIGIPSEDLEHIFEPFYRGRNKEFTDGNGIGLSLTEKIINLHGGKINVASRADQGTSFTVELNRLRF